jgi:KDO2-lipid IV(A) lauroyltransferase
VTLRHRVEYASARVALAFLRLLPGIVAYPVVGLLGRCYFRLSRRRQALALRFLRVAMGDAPSDRELLALGNRATGNIFKVVLDSVRLIPLAQRGRLLERVHFPADNHAVPEGAFLALTGHLGCWEAAGMVVAALGRRTHAIGKAARNPLLDAYMTRMRRRAGLEMHRRRGGIKELVNVLAAGDVAAMVVDQNQRLRPVVARFFGAPARCERSAAAIALRHGYPVMVGACLRVGVGLRFRMLIRGPVSLAGLAGDDGDLQAAIERINAVLEELIRQAPDQYLWIHDRYRGAP